MLSFIVCGSIWYFLVKANQCRFVYRLFIYVLLLDIILSRGVSVFVSVSAEYWAGTSLLNIVPRKWVGLSLY